MSQLEDEVEVYRDEVRELRDIIEFKERRIARLEDENKTLKLYYKDWLAQQKDVRGLREALRPFALQAETEFVKAAARNGQLFDMTARNDRGHLTPAYFLNAAFWHAKTEYKTGSAK